MFLGGTVFDGGDIALVLAVLAGVALLILALVFLLGWVGGRTFGRRRPFSG